MPLVFGCRLPSEYECCLESPCQFFGGHEKYSLKHQPGLVLFFLWIHSIFHPISWGTTTARSHPWRVESTCFMYISPSLAGQRCHSPNGWWPCSYLFASWISVHYLNFYLLPICYLSTICKVYSRFHKNVLYYTLTNNITHSSQYYIPSTCSLQI